MSKKVKVAFRGSGKPEIKDLDNDILKLDKTSDPLRHKLASGMINMLRGESHKDGVISSIDDLLLVLSSRYTSWARDMAIISAHLVGAKITGKEFQQDIYQKVLGKVQGLRHAHLFHNLPTMSDGPSWSPVNLLDIPRLLPNPKDHKLIIEDGEAVGEWNKAELESICESTLEYTWKDVHPYIAAKLRACLKSKNDHMFLVEPGEEKLKRALLVKKLNEEGKTIRCLFIGSVYFN